MAFLLALFDGLKLLLHWELYIIAIGYICLWAIEEMIFSSKNTSNGDPNNQTQNWPLLITEVFTHTLATTSFILILSPIILGISNEASWSYPVSLVTHDHYLILKALGLFLIVSILINFLPFIGEYRSVHTLILGAITLIYVLIDLDNKGTINLDDTNVILVPGLLGSLGFMLLCVISTWGAVVLSSIPMSLLHKKNELFMAPIFGIIGTSGLIPVFVYGSWLGNQITN
jgi:hypothetical protein